MPSRSARLVVAALVSVGSLLFVVSQSSSQPGKKATLPAKDAQAKVDALIQELFKEELAKAEKDPAARARLALTFLQEGKDTKDDLTARYVLYRRALELASQAGDAPVALETIEQLAQDFGLPAAQVFQLKVDALTAASKSVSTPDAYHTVVDASLVLLEDALGADDFPAARSLVATADQAARKLKNVPLVASIRKRGDDVLHLEKEFAHWAPFAKRLAENPGDLEASAEMGKYLALIKGNWERGLPLLAKGKKEGINALARIDLADPKESKAQVALANLWGKQAESFKETMRIQALLRAYHWYQQALGGTTAAAAPEIEARMKAIMELLPPDYRVGEIAVELKKCDGHFGPVFDGAFSPDGRKIVSAGGDNSVRLWDAKTGKELKRLDGHGARVWGVAFAPDGRRVVSAGFDSSVRLWDLASGREIRRFSGHTDYVRDVAISVDGHVVLSCGDDRTIRLWNTDTGNEMATLRGHNHFVWSVALSRDGKRALSGSLDKTVRLWDVEAAKEIVKLDGHKDTVLSVAFSPDGRRGVSGSTDRTLKIWDLETGKELKTLAGHKGYVQGVAFSPDGRRVLSAGSDGTVRLWDAHSGQQLRVLDGHKDQVWSVAFSRDGRLALSTSHDQTIRVWGGAK